LGTGNATVSVTAQANSSDVQREAKITVQMTGGALSREIAVTQASQPVDGYISGIIIGEHANWDQVSVSFDRGTTWAITVPVSGGKFSLTLPVPEEKYLENLEMVDSEYTVNPQGAKSAFADFYVRKGSQSTKLYMPDEYIEFWYVDKNVKITGSSTFMDNTFVFDMNLKKGWNAAGVVTEGTKTTKIVIPLPVGNEWEGF
jgi:hypothetical protein